MFTRLHFVLLASALLIGLAGMAQQSNVAGSTPAPAAAAASSSDADRAKIDALIKHYNDAYNHKNMEALLAIYPGLQNDQKEFKKVKWHLVEDPNVFSENMNLQAEDVQINGNQATVRAKRTEKYYSLENRSEIRNGDLNMQNMPAQDPGPSLVQRKHNSDKTDTVFMTLQRNGENWQIASLTAKKSK